MASIDYPETLPDFIIGKRRTQKQVYASGQSTAGPSHVIVETDSTPVTWDVRIKCKDRAQAVELRNFLQQTKNGVLFNKDILTEGGFIAHEVLWLVEPRSVSNITDGIFEYEATIYSPELEQPDACFDDGLIANWLQFGSELDRIVNEVLPSE